MNENTPQFLEDGIDLWELARLLWKNVLLIALAAVLAGSMAFAYTVFMISPRYSATVSMYVNSSSINLGSAKVSVSSSELYTSSSLVSVYLYILQSRTTLEEVIQNAGLNMSPGTLRGMLSTRSVTDTGAFEVTVTCSNPSYAELLANTIAKILPTRVSDIVDGSSVRIVDYAIIPSSRSCPDFVSNTMKGILAGIIVSCVLIVAYGLFNRDSKILIQSVDELRTMYPDITILTTVPDMRVSEKKSKYYSSYYYSTENGRKGAKKHG